MQQGSGSFLLKSTTQIEISSGSTEVNNVAQFLSDKLKRQQAIPHL
jgi:hypothetical protein